MGINVIIFEDVVLTSLLKYSSTGWLILNFLYISSSCLLSIIYEIIKIKIQMYYITFIVSKDSMNFI